MSKETDIDNNHNLLENQNEKESSNESLLYLREVKFFENNSYNPFISKEEKIKSEKISETLKKEENFKSKQKQEVNNNANMFPKNKIDLGTDLSSNEDKNIGKYTNIIEINENNKNSNLNNEDNNNDNSIYNDIIDIDDIKGDKDVGDIIITEKKEEGVNIVKNEEKDMDDNDKGNKEMNWFNRDGRKKLDEYAEINMKKILDEHLKQCNIRENKISELESLQFEIYYVSVNSNEKPKQLFDKKRPIIKFDNLNSVPKQLKENLIFLKYDYLTPIQREIMPYIQYGKDIVCISETGSGKTLSYLFPIIGKMLIDGVPKNIFKEKENSEEKKEKEKNRIKNKKEEEQFNIVYKKKIAYPLALIIVPSRELAIQIYKESEKLSMHTGIKTVPIIGGMSKSNQIANLSKGCDILVGTPMRIIYIMKTGFINLKMVKYLVLDESEKILEPDFYEQLKIILDELPTKNQRQNLLFSATMNDDVKGIAKYCMNNYYFFKPMREMPKQIKHYFIKFDEYLEKVDCLINYLKKDDVKNKSILIFMNSKNNIEKLRKILTEEGIVCTTLHGDKEQIDRFNSLKEFSLGYKKVLISTDLLSRGVDFPKVNTVINFDMPNNIEDYIHRAGRTGRMGQEGETITYIDGIEDINKENLINLLQNLGQNVPEWLKDVEPIRKYKKLAHKRCFNDYKNNKLNKRSNYYNNNNEFNYGPKNMNIYNYENEYGKNGRYNNINENNNIRNNNPENNFRFNINENNNFRFDSNENYNIRYNNENYNYMENPPHNRDNNILINTPLYNREIIRNNNHMENLYYNKDYNINNNYMENLPYNGDNISNNNHLEYWNNNYNRNNNIKIFHDNYNNNFNDNDSWANDNYKISENNLNNNTFNIMPSNNNIYNNISPNNSFNHISSNNNTFNHLNPNITLNNTFPNNDFNNSIPNNSIYSNIHRLKEINLKQDNKSPSYNYIYKYNGIGKDERGLPSNVSENLFLKGIHYDAEEQDIREVFSKYGEIVHVKILKNKITNMSRGIGYIKFRDKESAFNAMEDSDNIFVLGRKVTIDYSNTNKLDKKTNNKNNIKMNNIESYNSPQKLNPNSNDDSTNINSISNRNENESEYERRFDNWDIGRGKERGRFRGRDRGIRRNIMHKKRMGQDSWDFNIHNNLNDNILEEKNEIFGNMNENERSRDKEKENDSNMWYNS